MTKDRLFKSPYFFFLVDYARSVAARPHALKLASLTWKEEHCSLLLTFKNIWEVDL